MSDLLVDVVVKDRFNGKGFYTDHLFEVTDTFVILWNPHCRSGHFQEISMNRIVYIRDHITGIRLAENFNGIKAK